MHAFMFTLYCVSVYENHSLNITVIGLFMSCAQSASDQDCVKNCYVGVLMTLGILWLLERFCCILQTMENNTFKHIPYRIVAKQKSQTCLSIDQGGKNT